MNGLIKKMSAVAMAVGMLMTNVSYLPATSLIANAVESEVSDAEETVHIWDGTTDISWYDDEETEFHISTPEQLAGLSSIVNTGKTMEGKTFILDNDIYLNDVSTYDEWETTRPENIWTPISEFSGTFLGENHSIVGMYSNAGGMFEKVTNGVISELHLIDLYVNNSPVYYYQCNSGGLICESKKSSILNCSVQGTIDLNKEISASGIDESYSIFIGGLIGYCASGEIIGCSNLVNISVSVTARTYTYSSSSYKYETDADIYGRIGGICGGSFSHVFEGTALISNCINKGKFEYSGNFSGDSGIGGICGVSNSGKIISNCINYEEICSVGYSGGICGYNIGDILNCYNTGKIEGDGNGICGYNGGSVKNVYNTGVIEKGYAISSGSISNTYYLSGTALEGGPNTIAKTEANMKKESFADALGDAFYYVEGEYPKLAFEVGRTVSNFDKTSLSFNEYGETQTLTLETTYLGIPEWVSSDTSVATVDENGVVTAVGNGTAMIYALCSDSKAACSVSVGYDYYLSDNELSLKEGRVHDLTVYSASTNEKVTDVEIEWNSSDDSIVSVDSEGKLTANNKGTAAVTAKIADMELSCIVNVYEYTVPVTPAEDDENAPKLSEAEFSISTIESKKLSVMNYTDSITWISSNTAIAKVNDQGIVRAVAEGQTSIYALLSDGKCLKANVTVTESEYSMGDVNLDGKFDVADVVLLQKWLLAVPNTELKCWENADFYEDGILNVFDLCLMRKQLLS